MPGELDRLAATTFEDYSPSLVVNVVNDLIRLSREDVLERITAAAARVPPPPECTGLLWLIRVLFDVPARLSFPPCDLVHLWSRRRRTQTRFLAFQSISSRTSRSWWSQATFWAVYPNPWKNILPSLATTAGYGKSPWRRLREMTN